MQSLRWTVRVDRFSRKSAPNTYQSELVACKQGGATLELTYRFPGTGKVVRDELAIFREAYPFPEEAKVSIEGDLLIPLDLASELPYWMPLSCFVDWASFAIFVPQASANATAHILAALPADRVRAQHDSLMAVRHYFGFDTMLRHGPDAFEMLMLEVWMKAHFC